MGPFQKTPLSQQLRPLLRSICSQVRAQVAYCTVATAAAECAEPSPLMPAHLINFLRDMQRLQPARHAYALSGFFSASASPTKLSGYLSIMTQCVCAPDQAEALQAALQSACTGPRQADSAAKQPSGAVHAGSVGVLLSGAPEATAQVALLLLMDLCAVNRVM